MVLSKESSDLNARCCALDPGDEIVISGIAGQFPNSDSMNEFAKNLYEKAELLEDIESLWKELFPEMPEKFGQTSNVRKFDATFFGVHYKQAHLMDPSLRFILECAYETILDAGIHPSMFRGSRTGVFIGSTFLDMDKIFYIDKIVGGGFAITGCNRAMLANRISYSFGLQGPSMHLDTLSSATLTTLDVAYSAIRNGQCDAAIVGGSNVILHPYITAQYAQMGTLSPDGITRTFDKDVNGSTHSEVTCCILLQKAKDAKRIYAKVVHSKVSHSGYVEGDITQPSKEQQVKLLQQFYREINLSPTEVDYVETHCEGTLKYDTVEIDALDEVMTPGRKTPLKIGCVKSNIGNSQPCGGISGIAKIIIAMENNSIPPNMNLTTPHPAFKAITEGRMQVVTEPETISGKNLMAVQAMSFTGGNSHVLLESVAKDKVNKGIPDDDLPRVITWSGRTEDGVNEIFDYMCSQPLDAEFVALVHETQVETASNNIFRGYGVFQKGADGGNAVSLSREAQHFPGIKRPVVWVFSGMGSQWTQMGSSMMSIPIFRKSIEFCHEVLRPKNLDLIHLLTSDDPTIYDNILHSFVGIAAIQIAIVDVLRALDMQPDVIIGHSVGELGCAYADGCFTAEEMILAAYSRGKVSVETEKIFGSMAAVGLSYKKVRNLLPADIEVACRNSSISSTISGPAKSVETFVEELKKQGIFAKEVPCSNIAYHSRYIADMGPKLLELLTEVIKEPKKRSSKWLSTSVPQSQWEIEANQYSSARYHTNNLLNPVLFEDTFAMIPNNAVTIEIAPHGLLQAIIKKSKTQAIHIPLTQRGNRDNALFFLSALGKIFMNGIDFRMQNLYPPVEFPVSRGTPMIAPHIHWDHTTDWYVPPFSYEYGFKSGRRFVKVNPELPEFSFISHHVIDGKLLFPSMGFIFSIWETFSLINEGFFYDTDVEFSDLRFHEDLNLSTESERNLLILIQQGTGYFQVCDANTPLVSGYIKSLEPETTLIDFPEESNLDFPILQKKEFYRELYLRGYQYRETFQLVSEGRSDGSEGKVMFRNNWTAAFESLLQIFTIGQDTRDLLVPKFIKSIRIRPQDFLKAVNENAGKINVKVSKALKVITGDGIEVADVRMKMLRKSQHEGVAVSEYTKFIPHLPTPEMSTLNAARVCVQSFLDSSIRGKLKIVEVDACEGSNEILSHFAAAVNDLPNVSGLLVFLSARPLTIRGVHVEAGKLSSMQKCSIIIGKRCFHAGGFLEDALRCLVDGGYLISREEKCFDVKTIIPPSELSMILYFPTECETLVVWRKSSRKILPNTTVLEVTGNLDEDWLHKVHDSAKHGQVTLVSPRDSNFGITGLVNMLRKKIPHQTISCFSIEDRKFGDSTYRKQVKLSLATNVYSDGRWGSFRQLKLIEKVNQEATSKASFVEFIAPNAELKWTMGNVGDTCPGKRMIKVMYCGLNVRDREILKGEYPVEEMKLPRHETGMVLGSEFVGIDENGKRWMGVVHHGAMATQIHADEHFTFPIPQQWTLEEAATVPMAYLTVYTAFFSRINIKVKKSILIHAATDEVGIAAITVAQAYGLEVFATVDSQPKKEFLQNIFPNFPEDHIGWCSDISFESMIKHKTNNSGVHCVLNTLTGDKFTASLRCLGLTGKFLQIGKLDMVEDKGLGMGFFLGEIDFQAVEIDGIFRDDYEDREDIIKLMQQDIERGIVQPISSTIFKANNVNEAFDFYMGNSRMGKVLLKVRERETSKVSLPITISPRFSANEGSSYIIFCGLDGFGFEFADWLVIRGAMKLVLTSHGGNLTNYQLYRMRLWQSYGVQILYKLENQGTRSECLELIELAGKLGPVAGIFNASLCREYDRDDYFDGTEAEISVHPVKNFDELSRKFCQNLLYFVIFVRRSQDGAEIELCRAEMTISAIEKITEERCEHGLPGKVIHWGSLEGKNPPAGVLKQKTFSCLAEIDKLLFSRETILKHTILDKMSPRELNILDTVKRGMDITEIKCLDVPVRSLAYNYDMILNLKRQILKDFDLSFTTLNFQTLTCRQLLAIERERARENEGHLILANDTKPRGLEMLLQHLMDVNSTTERRITRIPSRDRSTEYKSCVVFIPGLVEILETDLAYLSLNIALPVFSLHITEDIGLLSIPELAKAIYPDIKRDALKTSEAFYLVSYSFGVYLTLELATLLEADGIPGQILLIDGAPDFFRQLLTDQLEDEYTDEDVEVLIVRNVLRIVFPDENPRELWPKCDVLSWRERVEKLVDVCRNQYVYTDVYIRYIADFLHQGIRHILNGTGKIAPISTPITLVRPTDVSVVDIERDYGMAKLTKGKFQLRFIDGDHATMLRNRSLMKIINEFDPRLKANRDFEDYMDI
ncbi:fatty acid synthase-like [Lutzomyia longipalpis]|uniref:fatty acid synthase-like n=1 Tax=Lutzomyia longipalpis TaxID=7200 RepID=UPI00248455DD|nr:fatty acid synthase-like [Lutzomyia longipalpis]